MEHRNRSLPQFATNVTATTLDTTVETPNEDDHDMLHERNVMALPKKRPTYKICAEAMERQRQRVLPSDAPPPTMSLERRSAQPSSKKKTQERGR